MKKLIALTALCAFALAPSLHAGLWNNGTATVEADAQVQPQAKSSYLNSDLEADALMTSKYQKNGNLDAQMTIDNDNNDDDTNTWFGMDKDDDNDDEEEMVEVDLNE